jgi:hypothetical protein
MSDQKFILDGFGGCWLKKILGVVPSVHFD